MRILSAVLFASVLAGPAFAQGKLQPSTGILLVAPTDGAGNVCTTAVPCTNTGGGGGGGGAVTTTPGQRTIVLLDVSTVTTGGTAVTALATGHASAGGFIVTSNAAGLCVDQYQTAGTVTGTPSSTACVAMNVPYQLVPSAHAVSVNSTASGVALGGEGLQ